METILHQFKGFHGYFSKCFIHIDDSNSEKTLICFEDIGRGTSVTNFSEHLATEIVALKGYDPEKCRFFEYYKERPEEADRIEYKWHGKVASEPKWLPMKPANLFWKQQGRIFKG